MKDIWERTRALHPRVRIGNDTPAWTRKRKTVYGVVLDDQYVERPNCATYEGALRKAEALSKKLTEDSQ